MTTINVYEVQLKIVNKNTKAVSAITRTEHAYSVMDAMMQAVLNQSAEIDTGFADITVTHIGPPQRLVEESERSLEKLVSELARGIGMRKAK